VISDQPPAIGATPGGHKKGDLSWLFVGPFLEQSGRAGLPFNNTAGVFGCFPEGMGIAGPLGPS
jgi:hypothetical protein